MMKNSAKFDFEFWHGFAIKQGGFVLDATDEALRLIFKLKADILLHEPVLPENLRSLKPTLTNILCNIYDDIHQGIIHVISRERIHQRQTYHRLQQRAKGWGDWMVEYATIWSGDPVFTQKDEVLKQQVFSDTAISLVNKIEIFSESIFRDLKSDKKPSPKMTASFQDAAESYLTSALPNPINLAIGNAIEILESLAQNSHLPAFTEESFVAWRRGLVVATNLKPFRSRDAHQYIQNSLHQPQPARTDLH